MDSEHVPHSDLVESLVLRFEVAWSEGESPRIDDFLPSDADDRRTVLVELIHIDLEFRLKAGEEARAEQYFAQFPEWNAEDDDALQLIVAEYNLRSRRELRPSLDEYRDRFPDHWDRLHRRLTATGGVDEETLLCPNPHGMTDDEHTRAPVAPTCEMTSSTGDGTGNRYQIIGNHASGGLGDVFIARDYEVPREVALKQLKTQFAHDPDSQARFLREAEITGGLEHPGIVPVYGMGAYADGRPYYAMRFIRGGSLKEAITRFHELDGSADMAGMRTLRFRKLLSRFVEVCHAIDYAHSRGVVHRDIKPSNIMVGKYGETLVVDWGLAKPIGRMSGLPETNEVTLRPQSGSGSSATQMGSAVGTPAYMSPEQATGQVDELGPATDVFSLGATLYELLTSQAPQTSRELSIVLNRVARGEFQPPRAVRSEIPVGLEAICLKAMALTSNDRYLSAGALAADIENWLADEPVAAHRESWWARSRRWMRRHRSVVASATVAGVLLAVTAVVALIAWDHDRQEDRIRLGRLQATAIAAEQSALTELRGDRYSSALVILDSALELLDSQPELAKFRGRIDDRRDHIGRLFDFHRLAAQAEEFSIFENDRGAISACWRALDGLGVFDHADWWAHLPVEELSPRQADRLRQRVYDQLILLTMLKGKSAILSFLSPTAAQDSLDLLDLAELVQRFRRAESIAALESYAKFRTGAELRLPDFTNLQPETAADNSATGLMFWGMSQNPIVRKVVLADRDVERDPINIAREFLTRAATLDPGRYPTMVTLGFINGQLKEYAAARQAFNQCIVLRPDDCLAYGLRAEAYLEEARGNDDQQRAAVLLRAALRDAEKARDLAPTTYYVHWYRGNILHEMGQTAEAVHAFMQAILLGKMASSDEQRFMDKQRVGIEKTKLIAEEFVQAHPENSDYRLLLATIELELRHDVEAVEAAQRVLSVKPDSAAALAIRGTVFLHRQEYESAKSDFQAALQIEGTNYRAAMGLARALEYLSEATATLDAYDRGVLSARTDWQVAEAQLGRCSALIRLKQFSDAVKALQTAVKNDPGCDVETVRELAEKYSAAAVLDRINGMKHLQLRDRISPRRFRVLPLLNGDFELGLSAYWGQPHQGKPIWWNRAGCRSFAEVTGSEKHGGELSLNIRHESLASEGVFAETSQAVPATPGARYRISLWAKTRGLAVNGAYLAVGSKSKIPSINLPAGTYDWVPLEGEFIASGDQALIRIVTRDVGEVWLDDIHIELADGIQTKN